MSASLYLRVGSLIDGTGGPIRKKIVLIIKDGYIQSIENDNGILPGAGLPGAGLPDLSERTILPALIDSHVHLTWSGTADKARRKDQIDYKFPDAEKNIKDNLKNHLRYGVLAIRDGGDKNGHTARFKAEHHQENIPLIRAAGFAWHKPGKYGSIIGHETPDIDSLSKNIKSAPHIDHIKIINSGLNSLTKFGEETPSQFSIDELKRISAIAAELGLPVMVHANGVIPVKSALESGCSSIEHGFFMGRDNLKRMADKNVFWSPTAVTMKSYSDLMDPESTESGIAAGNLDHQLDQMRMAREYGVPLVMGTDSGGMGIEHGASAAEELSLIITAGYSVSEAVYCATGRPSGLLKLKNTGKIVPGMSADLIAYHGEPDDLIKGLNSIERIFLKGKALSF